LPSMSQRNAPTTAGIAFRVSCFFFFWDVLAEGFARRRRGGGNPPRLGGFSIRKSFNPTDRPTDRQQAQHNAKRMQAKNRTERAVGSPALPVELWKMIVDALWGERAFLEMRRCCSSLRSVVSAVVERRIPAKLWRKGSIAFELLPGEGISATWRPGPTRKALLLIGHDEAARFCREDAPSGFDFAVIPPPPPPAKSIRGMQEFVFATRDMDCVLPHWRDFMDARIPCCKSALTKGRRPITNVFWKLLAAIERAAALRLDATKRMAVLFDVMKECFPMFKSRAASTGERNYFREAAEAFTSDRFQPANPHHLALLLWFAKMRRCVSNVSKRCSFRVGFDRWPCILYICSGDIAKAYRVGTMLCRLEGAGFTLKKMLSLCAKTILDRNDIWTQATAVGVGARREQDEAILSLARAVGPICSDDGSACICSGTDDEDENSDCSSPTPCPASDVATCSAFDWPPRPASELGCPDIWDAPEKPDIPRFHRLAVCTENEIKITTAKKALRRQLLALYESSAS
jgi:hypothetical protein